MTGPRPVGHDCASKRGHRWSRRTRHSATHRSWLGAVARVAVLYAIWRVCRNSGFPLNGRHIVVSPTHFRSGALRDGWLPGREGEHLWQPEGGRASLTRPGFLLTLLTPVVLTVYAIFLLATSLGKVTTTTDVVATVDCAQYEAKCTYVAGCTVVGFGRSALPSTALQHNEALSLKLCPGTTNYVDFVPSGWGATTAELRPADGYSWIKVERPAGNVGLVSQQRLVDPYTQNPPVFAERAIRLEAAGPGLWTVKATCVSCRVSALASAGRFFDLAPDRLSVRDAVTLEPVSPDVLVAPGDGTVLLDVYRLSPTVALLLSTNGSVPSAPVTYRLINLASSLPTIVGEAFPPLTGHHRPITNPLYSTHASHALLLATQGGLHYHVKPAAGPSGMSAEVLALPSDHPLRRDVACTAPVPPGVLPEPHAVVVIEGSGSVAVLLVNLASGVVIRQSDVTDVFDSKSFTCFASPTHACVAAEGKVDEALMVSLDLKTTQLTARMEFATPSFRSPHVLGLVDGMLGVALTGGSLLEVASLPASLDWHFVALDGNAVPNGVQTASALSVERITHKRAGGETAVSVSVQAGSVLDVSKAPCSATTGAGCLRVNVMPTEISIVEEAASPLSLLGTIGGMLGTIRLLFSFVKRALDKLSRKSPSIKVSQAPV